MKKLNLLAVFALALLALNFNACKKDNDEETTEETTNNGGTTTDGGSGTTKTTDQELLEMSTVATGFTWFKNVDTYLDRSAGSGHPQPFLRTRYNATAAAFLDTDGRVKEGSTFADGSLIVKELINADKSVARYAILYKKSDHADADDKGWVWGYVDPDGTVASAASNKGGSCIGCHTQGGNIDYMLMNKFYP